MSRLLQDALTALRSIPEIRDDRGRTLAQVFGDMDRGYAQVSTDAGFICRGCDDNCCRSLFYHHTLAEHRLLMDGFNRLPPEVGGRIRQRASVLAEAHRRDSEPADTLKRMCPLNEDGRCILYDYRPMICRLHGVPSRAVMPGGMVRTWPGCDDYYRQCPDGDATSLDRTPIYQSMAALEKRLRQEIGFTGRLKHTIAEMIVAICGDDKPI